MNERMSFEEFKKVVVENITNYLKGLEVEEVRIEEVLKNNNTGKEALIIRVVGEIATPSIYLDEMYEEYTRNNEEIEEILKLIAEERLSARLESGFDISEITDFEKCKDNIIPTLKNAQWNMKELYKKPFVCASEDLAVSFEIVLDINGKTASVGITDEIWDKWNISIGELYDIAIENLKRIRPSKFGGMLEMMGMRIDESEEKIFVLTNETKTKGATAILDEEMMDSIVDRFGEFYIIPSSIHEVIIIPKNIAVSVAEYKEMIKEVNETQVEPAERLSDNLYSYSKECGVYRVG